MRSLMVVDARARRMAAAMVFLMAVGVGFSIWRGDSPRMMLGFAVASLVGGGIVLGGYLWARRKN
jgi:hypothetical protein